MMANSSQFCPNPYIPTFKMTCPGALSLIEIMNWFFLFLYLYFTAVVYEYYVRGQAMPNLIKKEAAMEEQEKNRKKKEAEEKKQK